MLPLDGLKNLELSLRLRPEGQRKFSLRKRRKRVIEESLHLISFCSLIHIHFIIYIL